MESECEEVAIMLKRLLMESKGCLVITTTFDVLKDAVPILSG